MFGGQFLNDSQGMQDGCGVTRWWQQDQQGLSSLTAFEGYGGGAQVFIQGPAQEASGKVCECTCQAVRSQHTPQDQLLEEAEWIRPRPRCRPQNCG